MRKWLWRILLLLFFVWVGTLIQNCQPKPKPTVWITPEEAAQECPECGVGVESVKNK